MGGECAHVTGPVTGLTYRSVCWLFGDAMAVFIYSISAVSLIACGFAGMLASHVMETCRHVREHRMIRAPHRPIAVILLVLSASAFTNDTLCSSSESVVFSCLVERGKTISVCAYSPEQKEGKIAYRFGSTKKTDLNITADMSSETEVVEYNHKLLARAYNTFVRFKSGQYTYAVQQQWDGDAAFFAGVKVYRAAKLVVRRECSSARTSLDFELLRQSQIPISNHWPE